MGKARRHAAEYGADGEDDKRQREDPARSEPVGKPSTDRNEHGEGEDVGRDC